MQLFIYSVDCDLVPDLYLFLYAGRISPGDERIIFSTESPLIAAQQYAMEQRRILREITNGANCVRAR